MAWRFQASKFKNTTPKLPKREATIFDLPIGNLSCTNNGIQASDRYLAFHIEGEGGKLGVVTTSTRGRRLRKDISVIAAHAEQVDDFTFMPFAPETMVSCSRDDKLKIWRLDGSDYITSNLSAEIEIGAGFMLECVKPHSTAASIVAIGSTGSGYVVDIGQQKVVLEFVGINDRAQSLDWSPDGKLLAVSGDKGREVLIYDPRSGADPITVLEMHQGMGREGRVLFCGDRLLSSGFTNKRVQEVRLVDTGKWGAPVHIQEFVSTTGVLIPHYDPDTKLLYLTGKGTNKVFIVEQQDRQPLLSHVYELTLPEQNLGSCLGSKRNVAVMEGEVDTFYQLTKSSIIPIPCIVPRRTYRDFHADLFPDTIGPVAGCSAGEWLAGNDCQPGKVSLAPATTQKAPSPPPQESTPPAPLPVTPTAPAKVQMQIAEPVKPVELNAKAEVKELDYTKHLAKEVEKLDAHTPPYATVETAPKPPADSEAKAERKENIKPVAVIPEKKDDVKLRTSSASEPSRRPLSTRVRPKSCVVGTIQSKYRHVDTFISQKTDANFTNLRNINTRLPPECNGVCVSGQFVAVPLSGPAGVIGIYDVDEPVKLPDGVMDGIFNKTNVTDLQWNPFDDGELAVGTDCGQVNIWKLAKADGPRNEVEPVRTMKLGGEKIASLRWHPLAANLLAVALSDGSVELWDTLECARKSRMVNHDGAVLSMAWSADGRSLATLGKDFMLVIAQPQVPDNVRKLKVLESVRAARVLFACDDRLVVVVCFSKRSDRLVQLYDSDTLRVMYSQQIDQATQPLVPFYDYDSSVLFLIGKGDLTLYMFEVCYDSPYLLPLSHYRSSAGGQAIAFHNKKKCDVMAVEFQRGWRLTEKTLEQMIFRVPRVKKDVFQADLFPEALVTWEPVMTASEWLAGDQRPPKFISLKPDGVGSTGGVAPARRLPEAQPASATTSTSSGSPTLVATTTTYSERTITPQTTAAPVEPMEVLKKAAEVPHVDKGAIREMNNKLVGDSLSAYIPVDMKREQDNMEGVDEHEWKC